MHASYLSFDVRAIQFSDWMPSSAVANSGSTGMRRFWGGKSPDKRREKRVIKGDDLINAFEMGGNEQEQNDLCSHKQLEGNELERKRVILIQ